MFRRVTQQIHLGGLSNVFLSKGCPEIKQIFLFGNDFHTWHKHVCGVNEDLRHGIGHVDIRIGIMNSLECVCLPLHVHLGGE